MSTPAASMNVPQSQNTAPVLEYRCLYTNDLRRKQKRWQDGRLKFHTFNKRIMVYDEKANFVGDTHWREDSEFAEGEEVNLERSGIMVDVGECIGKREQDLTELVDKRLKDKEERAAANLSSTGASLFKPQGTLSSHNLQVKPLSALVTSSGHYGRALVPGTSPFKERQSATKAAEKDDSERPAKRRKPNEPAPKNGYAQNLLSTSLSLTSSRHPSTASIRYEPLKLKSINSIRSTSIDLTFDDSDESDGDRQNTAAKRQESTRTASKVQKKARRSPPAKNGYASNLTGAALSLKRPESSARTHIGGLSILRPGYVSDKQVRVASPVTDTVIDLSSSLEAPLGKRVKPIQPAKSGYASNLTGAALSLGKSVDSIYKRAGISPSQRKDARAHEDPHAADGFFDLSPSPEPLSKKPDPKKSIERAQKPAKPHRVNSPALPRSSSPVLESRNASTSVPRPTRSSIVNSSGMDDMPDRPMSALRIKSSQRPRMMMLMNRSSSRKASQLESFEPRRTEPTSVQQLKAPQNEIVLSQATIRLNTFCEKQDELAQARLAKTKRSKVVEVDEPSSSRSDHSWDHQTIDRMLSRRRSYDKNLSSSIEGPKSSSARRTSEHQPPIASRHLDADSAPVIQKSSSHSPMERNQQKAQSEVDTSPEMELDGKPSHGDSPSELRAPLLAINLDSSTDPKAEPEPEQEFVPSTDILGPIGDALIGIDSPSSSLDFENLPQYVQAATPRFTAMIKSAPTQDINLGRVPSPIPDVAREDGAPNPAPVAENAATDALQLPQKTFSELPQPPSGSEDFTEPGFSGPPVDEAPAAQTRIPAVSIQQPRRLVNPASGGRSLQSLAANTVSALNQTSNAIGPPPPRLSTRTDAVAKGPNGSETRNRGVVPGPSSDIGPWSREAFDLFGVSTHKAVRELRANASAG